MIPTYSLLPESWRDLARALVAELVGTMFLVLIGCGAAVNWKTTFDVTQVVFGLVGTLINFLQDEPKVECFQPSFVHQVSLAFGLAVMAIASFTGHVSGGKCSLVF